MLGCREMEGAKIADKPRCFTELVLSPKSQILVSVSVFTAVQMDFFKNPSWTRVRSKHFLPQRHEDTKGDWKDKDLKKTKTFDRCTG